MGSGLEALGGTVAAAQAPALFVKYVREGMKTLEFIKHEDEFLSELFDEISDFCWFLEAETKHWAGEKGAGDLTQGTQDAYNSVLSRCRDIKNGLYELHTEWKEVKSKRGWILKVKSRAAYMYWTKKSPIDELRQKLHLAKMDIVLFQLQSLRMSSRNDQILDKLGELESKLKSTLKSLDNSTDSEKENPRVGFGKRHLRRSIGSLDSFNTTTASVSVSGLQVSASSEEILQISRDATQNRPGPRATLTSRLKAAFAKIDAKPKSPGPDCSETRKLELPIFSEPKVSTAGHDEEQRDMDKEDTVSKENSLELTKLSNSNQEIGVFETGSTEQHDRGSNTFPSTGAFADFTTKQSVSSAEVESVDFRSGIHPYPTYEDRYIRQDTAIVALSFGPLWDLVLFQEPGNYIQCVLVPRALVAPAECITWSEKAAPIPRTVIFSSSLEAVSGSCFTAMVTQSRVHVVYIKEREDGRCVLADAYLLFEPWFRDLDLLERLDADFEFENALEDPRRPQILADCWEKGNLEARDLELSSRAEITIFRIPDGSFEVCIQFDSGQTGYVELDLDSDTTRRQKPLRYSEQLRVSRSVTPKDRKPENCRRPYRRKWDNSWFTSKQGSSFLVFEHNEETSLLEAKLVNWNSLKTEASATVLPFSQLSWQSVVLEREMLADEGARESILMFFSDSSGEISCTRLQFTDHNYNKPKYMVPLQTLAPRGSTKAGTKMSYAKGRLFYISEEGLLMVLALKLNPSLERGIYDVGECQPILANGCYMTSLKDISRFKLDCVHSLCEGGPLEENGFRLI